jgi:intracellular sulfur oxidation DsrE/DsrF family protein
LLDLPFHPNSKDQLKQKGVEFKLCKLTLENAEIDELVKMMKGIGLFKKLPS